MGIYNFLKLEKEIGGRIFSFLGRGFYYAKNHINLKKINKKGKKVASGLVKD